MKIFKKGDTTRQMWQDRLAKARAAYSAELARMDEFDQYYNGTRKLRSDPNSGRAPKRVSSNVRNIVYELIESQVDSTIPMPRVEAIHEADRPLAKKIEAILRNKVIAQRFSTMNDLQERTVPIQGGSFWDVAWDSKGGTHCTLGDVTVSDRHPKMVIPQPGVNEVKDMDYIFLQLAQTKSTIKQRYGVDVDECTEENATVRGSDEVGSAEDLVTQNIAYYRNEDGGIGLFSWVDDITLEDLDDCQARRVERCAKCGAVKVGDVCPECGSRKFKFEKEEYEELFEDKILYDGSILSAVESTEEVELTDPMGEAVLDEEGNPATQMRTKMRKIPYYEPRQYPLILRRNISRYGSFLGGSDVAVIEDQQDSIKKMGAKIDEKILKGGSFVTLPRGVDVETTDREFKIVRVENPAQKSLISVVNVQPDPTKERIALEDNYQWAKSTLGITDAFQGKYDSSATSGTAKQFSANQAAGRLQSKREMKNQAYGLLYELMFKYLLAYSDQPMPYTSRDDNGEITYEHFDRWEFLRVDKAGEPYWDDEFIFSVDPSATLTSNRDLLWQQIAQNYQSGAFGPLNETHTQVLLWQLLSLTNYPYAGEIHKSLESKEAEEKQQMQAMQQEMEAQNAMPQMPGGMPNPQDLQ